LALVGIHLCKTLSPTCVGIVNTLSPLKCPFLCLVPCCLPRVVVSTKQERTRNTRKSAIIQVRQYETREERQGRMVAAQRRAAAMTRNLDCYVCASSEHRVHECSLLPSPVKERIEIFRRAAQQAPCWKCGAMGHVKADCPSDQTTGKPSLLLPPVASMDVSEVLLSEKPFDTYCDLLAGTLQRENVQLVETGLIANDRGHTQAGNWNSGRKSIYIVASHSGSYGV
jgi:hypothetical protein